jgi:hypothetical protein
LNIVVDPNNRDLFALDAVSKLFESAKYRITELVELPVDCRICCSESKSREEAIDETIGVA